MGWVDPVWVPGAYQTSWKCPRLHPCAATRSVIHQINSLVFIWLFTSRSLQTCRKIIPTQERCRNKAVEWFWPFSLWIWLSAMCFFLVWPTGMNPGVWQLLWTWSNARIGQSSSQQCFSEAKTIILLTQPSAIHRSLNAAHPVSVQPRHCPAICLLYLKWH